MFKTYVKGTGSYLPENKMTNKDFEKSIETSDEWIFSRTGISSRNIAGKDQTTSDLAYEAAVKAMAMAQVEPHDIDFIFVATTSPDYVMPNTACILQSKIRNSYFLWSLGCCSCMHRVYIFYFYCRPND